MSLVADHGGMALVPRASAIGGVAAAVLLAVAACSQSPAASHSPARGPGTAITVPRPVPSPLYGVTADNVTNLDQIVASSGQLPAMPTTRIVFDSSRPPEYYTAAVNDLHRVSYLMGELTDSADVTKITTPAYGERARAYLDAFGSKIDIWEIGNEVNGNWTGPYPDVAAKLEAAYNQVAARHLRTALTLYYNVGCGDGPDELSPLDFSRQYVPQAVRDGLDYVFLSYYEDQCGGMRPTAQTWTAYFSALHALYPNARLGFGEIGLTNPATAQTTTVAESLINYYYGLSIRLPYYAGGYFWWYYAEDCLPYKTKPLWRTLSDGFTAEQAARG